MVAKALLAILASLQGLPAAHAIVWKQNHQAALLDTSATPDCTGELVEGGEASCDDYFKSSSKCEGYTLVTAGTYAQCKKTDSKNCLAVGPMCNKPPAPKNHWYKGAAGSVCTKVCKDNGFTKCNKGKMAGIDSADKIKEAMQKGGYTCRSVGGHRSYAGSPFTTHRAGDDCYYFSPGTAASSINCDGNKYNTHGPLCYCE